MLLYCISSIFLQAELIGLAEKSHEMTFWVAIILWELSVANCQMVEIHAAIGMRPITQDGRRME